MWNSTCKQQRQVSLLVHVVGTISLDKRHKMNIIFTFFHEKIRCVTRLEQLFRTLLMRMRNKGFCRDLRNISAKAHKSYKLYENTPTQTY